MQPRVKPSFDLRGFLDRVGLPGTPLEFAPGQVVFRQGEPAKALFYIQKGGVKLSVLSGHGKEAVIAILTMDTFFGEGCLAGQRVRMATAKAIGPSAMLRIDRKEMVRVLHDEHAFSDFSFDICSCATFELKLTWSINFSTPAKNDWPGRCCWSHTMEIRANQKQTFPKSARKHWPK